MLGFLPAQILDDKLRQEKNYWLHKLSGELPVSGLPLDSARPKSLGEEHETVRLKIEPEVASRLLGACRNAEALVFAALATALNICLYKYTGVEDVVAGATVHERYREVAALNQILILRNPVAATATLRELLQDMRQTLSEAYAHQKYPFDRILELLDIEYPGNRAPLFNVALVLDNINNRENLRHLKNDVTLSFSITGGGLAGAIEYYPALFQRKTIEIFGEHYQAILRAMLDNPDCRIAELDLLSSEKKQELVFDFNDTGSDYPQDQTICRLFEEQAARTPDQVAVECRGERLTYRQLNARANQLARYLQSLAVGPGVRVGLYVEHSLEAVVGLWGVLKAGGAYVPLDPAHPKARLAFVLADAQIPVILTQERLADRLPDHAAKLICLDAGQAELEQASAENLPGAARAADLAYVIYTSGSTGNPKGVKIQHSSLVNYIWWAKEMYLRNERLDFPLYSSLAFDLTVTSIYTPLITGNKVIIYPQEGKEPPILQVLEDNRVGVLKLTPSHLALIKDKDNRSTCLRRLIVGGEALDADLTRQIHAGFGGKVEIFNEYGPTEATVGCMHYLFDPARDRRAWVPIGKPAANVQIYILDERLNPIAENMLGELHIAGAGLAQGYLNQDELTASKFVDNPFTPGAKLYKTGDLARWLPQAEIEFLGRADDQVKFHGYRVELNEIRSALNRHPQIRDSVVLIKKDPHGHAVMIAYYVSRRELESAQLRAFLLESIIEETLPNFFVHLTRLPLTLNGKVNTHALPALDEIKQGLKRAFVAPRTPTEAVLAEIWGQVLGLKQVGVYDNFFELGGHSLLATQVISRVRDAFQIELPMRALFENPTIAGMTEAVIQQQGEQKKSGPEIVRLDDQGYAEQMLGRLDELADEEVDLLLDKMLKERQG